VAPKVEEEEQPQQNQMVLLDQAEEAAFALRREFPPTLDSFGHKSLSRWSSQQDDPTANFVIPGERPGEGFLAQLLRLFECG